MLFQELFGDFWRIYFWQFDICRIFYWKISQALPLMAVFFLNRWTNGGSYLTGSTWSWWWVLHFLRAKTWFFHGWADFCQRWFIPFALRFNNMVFFVWLPSSDVRLSRFNSLRWVLQFPLNFLQGVKVFRGFDISLFFFIKITGVFWTS